MRAIVIAAGILAVVTASPSGGAAREFREVEVKLGVETVFEVAQGDALGLILKPRKEGVDTMTICNRSAVDGQFGLVEPVELPPPVPLAFLKAGECWTLRGSYDVQINGRHAAWTGTVLFK